MKITHQTRHTIQNSGVFTNVTNYDELNASIQSFGLRLGKKGSDEYNNFVGDAYEIYNQYFCLIFGTTPLLGINEFTDTSLDPFNDGYDFGFTSTDNLPGMLQTKWTSNPDKKFTRKFLGTFSSVLRDFNITPTNSILFTNIRHTPSKEKGSVFHHSWDTFARKQMRVIDRTVQEQFILRTSSFWDDFRECLEESCKFEFTEVYTNEPHQDEMEEASNRVIDGELERGRVICATAGGKTLIEYRNILNVLTELDEKLTIIVAPTRDLVDQHFNVAHNFGVFHNHGDIGGITFKSGSEPARHSDGMSFLQTTNLGNDLIPFIAHHDKNHICTTYKSISNLLEILEEHDIIPDLIIFDEFQHLVSQTITETGISNPLEFIKNLKALRILFYSASQKRGRIINSFNEDLFGPELVNISYKQLREAGIVKQRIRFWPISVSGNNIKGLSKSIRDHSELFEKVDLKQAIEEAATVIVAAGHASTLKPNVNLITWSKKISHMRTIESSDAVTERLNEYSAHMIYSDIPSRNRTSIYDTIRESHSNILFQHSCVSEGVDVANLNTAVICRRLSMIELQQGPIGRNVRIHPTDRANLKVGIISIDSPDGWVDYYADVYVLVSNNEDDSRADYYKDLIDKLQYAGLTEADYEFHDINEERTGDTDTDDSWMVGLDGGSLINDESLEDTIAKARVKLEEEYQQFEEDEEITLFKALSIEDMIADIQE